MERDIASDLAELDAHSAPAARQFDTGPRVSGRVAVLPSAFNPPTIAHQHLLERAAQLAQGSRPVALLTTRNVDKGLHGASLAQRVEMLLALHEEWPALAVIASNQARIIDQARALEDSFEIGTDAGDLRFVMGFDTLERLFAHRYYTDMETELAPFFERWRVIATNRADVGTEAVHQWIKKSAATFADRIDVLEIEEFPASLSSTRVRDALGSGRDAAEVPHSVRRYIERNGLYRA